MTVHIYCPHCNKLLVGVNGPYSGEVECGRCHSRLGFEVTRALLGARRLCVKIFGLEENAKNVLA